MQEAKRGATTTKVADELRRMIYAGTLAHGEKLVQERLAAQLGVSRVPLREAFVELASEGLIELRLNRGAVVSAVTADEVQQYMEMRARLETFLLARAIPIFNDDDFEAAETALDILSAADPDEWPAMNLAFHCALYRPANRAFILAEAEKLYWATYRRAEPLVAKMRDYERADREHRALLGLVRSRDSRGAAELLESHILLSGQSVVDALRAEESRRKM